MWGQSIGNSNFTNKITVKIWQDRATGKLCLSTEETEPSVRKGKKWADKYLMV